MKTTDISFIVSLDARNYPEKITWTASDAENLPHETKSISLNVWDHRERNTLRIDLWTKDMRTDEMKKFVIDCLGGMAQSVLNSTGDSYMSSELNLLCDKLAEHVRKETSPDEGKRST
jgi:gliding motility-associated protein GldC